MHFGPKNMKKARELIHQLFPGHRRIPFGIKNRQYVLKGYHDKYDKNKIRVKSLKNSENATREISPDDFQALPESDHADEEWH